jgi:tuberculosinol/isotuberculosinol synthase
LDVTTFVNLPTREVARLVRADGPKVCAFPINGTRRWFLLENPVAADDDWRASYLNTMSETHITLYGMLFDHGIDTLLAPVFGPDLIARGDTYTDMAMRGLERLATHPTFLNFYDEYGVRVGFYGDYRRVLASTSYTYLGDLFDEITDKTAAHNRHRILFGVCANDAVESVAEITVRHYLDTGRAPNRQALIFQYYGMDVPPLSFFIGFDKFSVFDTPLLTSGNEDLYFTVSPSLYLTEQQLREILYDHLYTRRMEETDYSSLKTEDVETIRAFYRVNRGKTLGVGAIHARGGFWYPLPQVELSTETLEPAAQS